MKLDPQSIKYIHIGCYGHGGYKLHDPASGNIIKSHNVIFEEGIGHRMRAAQELSGMEEDFDTTMAVLTEPGPDTTGPAIIKDV